MLRHLKMLVSRAAAHPDEAVERLPMLDADETHRQIVEWNETARAYPRGVCIHEIFEAQ
jgi:non-ribosomal peptide synthetase component F